MKYTVRVGSIDLMFVKRPYIVLLMVIANQTRIFSRKSFIRKRKPLPSQSNVSPVSNTHQSHVVANVLVEEKSSDNCVYETDNHELTQQGRIALQLTNDTSYKLEEYVRIHQLFKQI